MSSIQTIKASSQMPKDLAKLLGQAGIIEILSVMWKGYADLKKEQCITSNMTENAITQEWFIRISNYWYQENRAARINIHLTPIHQYGDNTLAKERGTSPVIDFCFRAWDSKDGYFGAECKNLYDHDTKHIKRYVSTGVENYTSGRYGSKSSVSSIVGYVLTGVIPEIVEDLSKEMVKRGPRLNLTRELGVDDPQYKSMHLRTFDNQIITLHHLFFDFASKTSR